MILGRVAPRGATYEELEAAAVKSVYCCSDPCHDHVWPVQVSYAVEYHGHHVSVTVDGECFSVEIDRDSRIVIENVSRAQARAFIEQKTSKEKSNE